MFSSTSSVRPTGRLLLLVSLFAAVGCGSGAFTTRAGDGDSTAPRGSEATHEGGHEARAPVAQAQLPDGPIDVQGSWERGDSAFQSGDPGTAQMEFGRVYLADPNYRGGQVRAALLETCNTLGNDCYLVMGRLDHLRLAYSGQFGPRAQWVPQQESDYQAILDCWNQALAGNFDAAYYAGYAAVSAPLPAFAASARACVDRVSALQSQAAAYEQQRAAAETWDSAFPAYREAWVALEPGLTQGDWDAIVDNYPGYKLAEEPVAEVIDGGTLVADPERGVQVVEASEWLETVRDWEADHADEYATMRDAINALDEDSEYNQALMEYESVHMRIPPLEGEVRSLEVARDATSGADRRNIERRIDAKEAEIREVRRDLRRIMASVNNLREAHGLPRRDAPYGMD